MEKICEQEKYLCLTNLYDFARDRVFTAGKIYKGTFINNDGEKEIHFSADNYGHDHIVVDDWLNHFEKQEHENT